MPNSVLQSQVQRCPKDAAIELAAVATRPVAATALRVRIRNDNEDQRPARTTAIKRSSYFAPSAMSFRLPPVPTEEDLGIREGTTSSSRPARPFFLNDPVAIALGCRRGRSVGDEMRADCRPRQEHRSRA